MELYKVGFGRALRIVTEEWINRFGGKKHKKQKHKQKTISLPSIPSGASGMISG